MNNVAVIMSIYRNDILDYVKDSVESITNQTYKNLSIFICYDGFVSEEICDYIAALQAIHKNIYVFKNETNQGLARSLNLLIDEVLRLDTYEFIARMDSDDISLNIRIDEQVRFLINNPHIDVCGSYCKEFGAEFALEEKKLPVDHCSLTRFSIARCPFIHPTVVFRVKIFKDGHRYPTQTALTEDMAFWFHLLFFKYKFANISKILLHYRINKDTLYRRKGFMKAMSEVSIRFKYMFLLKQISFKNIFLIASRLFIHILPNIFLSLLYKKIRN